MTEQLPENLFLKQLLIGPLDNFIYILADQESRDAVVFDPAWDVPLISRVIEENDLKVTAVWLTHGHPDHVNGLDEFLDKYPVDAFIAEAEAPFYKPEHPRLKTLQDQSRVSVGGLTFRCLLTPGHAPGCLCYLHENVLIAGDTLFIDGCGRCDLPGSSPEAMYHSLYDIIKKLPEETLVFPGHNYGPKPFDTIGAQKISNPYLTCSSKEEFLRERMGA